MNRRGCSANNPADGSMFTAQLSSWHISVLNGCPDFQALACSDRSEANIFLSGLTAQEDVHGSM